jgi:hypothetical protein
MNPLADVSHLTAIAIPGDVESFRAAGDADLGLHRISGLRGLAQTRSLTLSKLAG